tara:strand:- start:3517 stop:4653 length:1137 start_codon:yes stop_codon:yes gene_type:complete
MTDAYINNKLKYKIKLFNCQTFNIDTSLNSYKFLLKNNIIYVNDSSFSIDGSLNKILYIFQVNNNEYNLLINQKHIIKLDKIKNIDLLSNNYYKCSINIPIGLKNSSIETLINFKYSIEKYINYDYQINILHTDSYIYTIDEIALANDNLNYIFVENPYNFNLGYTRNLYKYLSLSVNILFVDCDIPLDEKYIDIMVKQAEEYDIIKPYDKILINLTKEEKIEYLKKPFVPNRKAEKIYSITGGISLIKKSIIDSLGGYEEINTYGYEDRFLDVMILYKNYKIKKNDFKLVHLWHPIQASLINNFNIFDKNVRIFNKKYYNCFYTKPCINNLHENCCHNNDYIDKLIEHKKKYNANLNLFIDNNFKDSIILKEELILY